MIAARNCCDKSLVQRYIPSRILAAVPILWLGLASSAVAEPAVNLTYDAAPDCPPQREFVAAVESRGGHFETSDHQETPRLIAVKIRKGDDAFTGSLEVRSREASSAAREVHAATCHDVVDALAVVTAIELRAENEEKPEPIAATKSDEPTFPLAVPAPNRDAKPFNGKSSWGNDEVAVGAGTLRFKSMLNWTLAVGAAIGPFPRVTFPRYDVVFRFANAVTTPEGNQRINGPILRARGTLYGPPLVTYRSNDTVTEFELGVGLGLGVCWSPHYDTRGLALFTCADFGYAQMGLTPVAANGTRSPTKAMWFGTGGPLLEVEYNFGAWLHLGAKVGFDVIAGNFTAQRADGTEAWKTRPWSSYGSLGLGLHF